jgi:hypothetical protein
MFSCDTAQEIKGYLRGGLPSNLRLTSIVEKACNKPSLKPLRAQAFLRSVLNRSGWVARMNPPEAGGIHAGNPQSFSVTNLPLSIPHRGSADSISKTGADHPFKRSRSRARFRSLDSADF